MKILKIILGLTLAYILIVVTFETLIGTLQPQGEENLVLISWDADGAEYSRVLSRIELDEQVYVAVNHWPRAWYHRIQENPSVKITFADTTEDYMAVPVTSESEIQTVRTARPFGLMFRVLTGFPPRYFVRLDPVVSATAPVGSDVIEPKPSDELPDLTVS
jgi:hypothetical protein